MREHFKAILNKNNETGATAVEFAVVAAILFIILFGILEFGFIFMQEHYVANAAREGVRIGIKANNYDCFNGDTEDVCHVDRQIVVRDAVRDYLSTLYSAADIIKPVLGTSDISRDPDENISSTNKTLSVTVEVNNFFPPILSSLAAIIPGTGFVLPSTISYTAQGEYEDPSEP